MGSAEHACNHIDRYDRLYIQPALCFLDPTADLELDLQYSAVQVSMQDLPHGSAARFAG